ncbi:MAG: MFS transporter, partial [Burkholderiales bacterium]
FSPRSLLGFLGVTMSAAAFFMATVSTQWPVVAIYLLAFVFGASAVGWNGVYLAEIARIAPTGRAGAATGASLAITYSGVVVLPLLFWVVQMSTESYGTAFVSVGVLSLFRGLLFFRSR